MKKLGLLLLLLAQQALGGTLPRPDHVVIVVEENRAYSEIIGNREAPYINSLARRGMLFTNSHGVTHPSLPNYLALFAGSTYNIASDACPLELSGGNLADSLQERSLSFAIYSESLPEVGAAGCIYGGYRRKHNPVAAWKELAALSLPFSAFPRDFSKLPTVSWVIPDQRNDMHDGSVARGDVWLKRNLGTYAKWAAGHNSLLIVTWDEDYNSPSNRVATIFFGQIVRHGSSMQPVNHYSVLRTIEEMYGLPALNNSAHVRAIEGAWRKARH